jgi:hypothetical protein
MSFATASSISFYAAFGGYLISLLLSLLKDRRPSDSISHSSAAGVDFVIGSSTYGQSTPASPPPCRLGIILNAKWNDLFFAAGFISHTVSQLCRGLYLGFFFPNPMFNEISFLPWCLAFLILASRFFGKEIKSFPHIIPVVLFVGIALLYPKGVIPPFVKNLCVFSPLFFVLEVLAHACFILGGWLAFFFIWQKNNNRLFHDLLIWGFVFYSVAQICGSIWAYLGWGSPFHWADKHLGSAAIWCYYAAYIHLSFVGRWDIKKRAGIAFLGLFLVLEFSSDYQLAELTRIIR